MDLCFHLCSNNWMCEASPLMLYIANVRGVELILATQRGLSNGQEWPLRIWSTYTIQRRALTQYTSNPFIPFLLWLPVTDDKPPDILRGPFKCHRFTAAAAQLCVTKTQLRRPWKGWQKDSAPWSGTQRREESCHLQLVRAQRQWRQGRAKPPVTIDNSCATTEHTQTVATWRLRTGSVLNGPNVTEYMCGFTLCS